VLDYSKLEDLFRYLDDLTGNKTDREMIGYANQVKETIGHLSVNFLESLLEKAISKYFGSFAENFLRERVLLVHCRRNHCLRTIYPMQFLCY